MEAQLTVQQMQTARMDEAVREVFNKEGEKLFRFIRSRVPTEEDAEDIFQEVFYQLADAYFVAKDIQNGGAWVFRVARNKIIDFFRKHKTERLEDIAVYAGGDDDEQLYLQDILPSPDEGPDYEFFRNMVSEVIEGTLVALPKNQRMVFEMHEFDGRSFKEIAEVTGENENTLITRKRYAILKLRENLRMLYDEMLNQ